MPPSAGPKSRPGSTTARTRRTFSIAGRTPHRAVSRRLIGEGIPSVGSLCNSPSDFPGVGVPGIDRGAETRTSDDRMRHADGLSCRRGSPGDLGSIGSSHPSGRLFHGFAFAVKREVGTTFVADLNRSQAGRSPSRTPVVGPFAAPPTVFRRDSASTGGSARWLISVPPTRSALLRDADAQPPSRTPCACPLEPGNRRAERRRVPTP